MVNAISFHNEHTYKQEQTTLCIELATVKCNLMVNGSHTPLS